MSARASARPAFWPAFYGTLAGPASPGNDVRQVVAPPVQAPATHLPRRLRPVLWLQPRFAPYRCYLVSPPGRRNLRCTGKQRTSQRLSMKPQMPCGNLMVITTASSPSAIRYQVP